MDTTTTRRLGRTALAPTVLGFGGSGIGNLQRPVAEEAAIEALESAYAAGIRYFDTAPLYGGGIGEHRVGRVLRRHPRDSFVLSTKVGRLLRPVRDSAASNWRDGDRLPFEVVHDYGHDATLRSVEDSLQRIGVARIDVALIHDIDPYNHGDAAPTRFREAMAGAYPALERLRGEGVIGAIGVGVNDWRVCRDCALGGDFDCFLLAGRYTLLEQPALRGLLDLCASRTIGVVVGAPFNSGVLAYDEPGRGTYNHNAPDTQVNERLAAIRAVCATHGVSPGAAALQFPLGHPAVVSVLPGMRSTEHVRRNIAWLAEPLPSALWADLKARALIDPDAPVPAGAEHSAPSTRG